MDRDFQKNKNFLIKKVKTFGLKTFFLSSVSISAKCACIKNYAGLVNLGRYTLKKYRDSKNNIVAIDITALALKVLKVNKDGANYQIVDYCIVDFDKKIDPVTLTKEGIEQVKVALQTAIRKLKIEKYKVTILLADTIIDHNSLNISKDVFGGEIKQTIENFLSQKSNNKIKNIFYDYVYSGEEVGENTHKVNLFWVQKTFLEPKIEILNELGLIPEASLISRDAIESFLKHLNFSEEEPLILFDVSEDNNCIYLRDNKSIFYSKEDRYSIKDLLDSIKSKFKCQTENARNILKKGDFDENLNDELITPFIDKLYTQIDTVVKFSGGVSLSNYKQIIIVGDINNYPDIVRQFNAKSENFKPMSLKSSVSVSPDIQENFNIDKSSLFKTMGAAFSHGEAYPNLLPWREEKIKENVKSYKKAALLSVMIGLVFSLGGYTYFSQSLNKQTSYNAEIQSDIDVIAVNYTKLKTVSEKKDRLNKRIELIQSLQKQRPVLTLALNSIVESMPSTVYLEELRKDGDKFTFKGKASSADEVATFMRSLKNTMWFDKVFMVSFTDYSSDSKDAQNKEKEGSSELTATTEKSSGSGVVMVPKVPEDIYGTFVVTAELVPTNIDKVGFGDAVVREIQMRPSDSNNISISDSGFSDDGPKVLGVVKGRALPLDSGVNPESAKSELSPDRFLEMKLRALHGGSN